jgi:hypothetical protein
VVRAGRGVGVVAGLAGEVLSPTDLNVEAVGDGDQAPGSVTTGADRVVDPLGKDLRQAGVRVGRADPLGVPVLLEKVVALDTELGPQADRHIAVVVLVVAAGAVAVLALGVTQVGQRGIAGDELGIVAQPQLGRVGPAEPAGDVIKAAVVGDGVLADGVAVDTVLQVKGAGLPVHRPAQRLAMARVAPGGDLVVVALDTLGRVVGGAAHQAGADPGPGVEPQGGGPAGDPVRIGDGEGDRIDAGPVGDQDGKAGGRVVERRGRAGRRLELPAVRRDRLGQDALAAPLEEDVGAGADVLEPAGDDDLTGAIHHHLGRQPGEVDGGLGLFRHGRRPAGLADKRRDRGGLLGPPAAGGEQKQPEGQQQRTRPRVQAP